MGKNVYLRLIWNVYKKSFNAIEILLKFGFIVNDSKYFNEIYNYNLLIFGSEKLSIEKTTVTFIDELDIHKLFKSKSYPPTNKYKDNSISLKEIKKNEKEVSKKYIKELKTKNNFIFNIQFLDKEKENEKVIPSKNLIFSIYFKNKKIEKIQTIYEWYEWYEWDDEWLDDLDSFINSIKLIKKMFNLDAILYLLDEKWSSNHILNQKFSILKEELIKLEKSTNE